MQSLGAVCGSELPAAVVLPIAANVAVRAGYGSKKNEGNTTRFRFTGLIERFKPPFWTLAGSLGEHDKSPP